MQDVTQLLWRRQRDRRERRGYRDRSAERFGQPGYAPDRVVPFVHLVLTRFNVPGYGAVLDEDWLLHRLDLFRRFTLPSIDAQTVRSFRWIVFVDSSSPAWLLDELESLLGDERYEIVPVQSAGTGRLAAELVAEHGQPDDSRDHDPSRQRRRGGTRLRRGNPGRLLRSAVRVRRIPSGAKLVDGRSVLAPHRANPFVSLVERLDPEVRRARSLSASTSTSRPGARSGS